MIHNEVHQTYDRLRPYCTRVCSLHIRYVRDKATSVDHVALSIGTHKFMTVYHLRDRAGVHKIMCSCHTDLRAKCCSQLRQPVGTKLRTASRLASRWFAFFCNTCSYGYRCYAAATLVVDYPLNNLKFCIFDLGMALTNRLCTILQYNTTVH